jgi:SRSO17 transposase
MMPMTPEQIQSLQEELGAFLEEFRPYFKRRKTFGYLQKYLLGLLADLKRKSIEPIALAAGVPVRTLQEFLAFFVWDHERMDDALTRKVADHFGSSRALGILDASAHAKQGTKTPGVQRQYCGETGKNDNCVVGQHLLYSDDDPVNPFNCVLDSQLYLPKSWLEDRPRCDQAGIPAQVCFRTKWEIALEQLRRAVANGIRLAYVVFDADYGRANQFWFGLDRLGLIGAGGVPPDFHCWVKLPHACSSRAEHAPKRVDHLLTHSPTLVQQPWKEVSVRVMTRGLSRWRMKAARVHLIAERPTDPHKASLPTDRQYWLIAGENVATEERKFFVSNAPADANPEDLLRAALARWHVEQWFERAKQEAGLGAFEVRTYQSLIRHWLCSRLAMFFLALQTRRLRGEKSEDHGRAGEQRRQFAELESMATRAECLEQQNSAVSVSSAA